MPFNNSLINFVVSSGASFFGAAAAAAAAAVAATAAAAAAKCAKCPTPMLGRWNAHHYVIITKKSDPYAGSLECPSLF